MAFTTAAPPPVPQEKNYYSEDLIRRNIGKPIIAYMTFPQNDQWRGKIFTGTLTESGRDYFVIIQPDTKKNIILLTVNLDYMVINTPTETTTMSPIPQKPTRKT
ncbi:spore coat protein GerQ [Pasteuria penetrans]|uniref:spore coat protein GerQ n=1 Tax=Pasteuria penetrans TaxID=86005 RepID=UPI00165B3539